MRRFPAKVMLFGEYAVIRGSRALAVPYPKKGGKLYLEDQWSDISKQSNEFIRSLHSYLDHNPAFDFIDAEGMYQDLDHLAFETDIPIGYGLGSSGALVAAIYEQYKRGDAADNAELMHRLASMESCFHGQSSGLDPLVSYLQMAVITEKGEDIQVVAPPKLNHFFLLDTGLSRSTATLVEHFKKQLEEESFQRVVDRLSRLNATCIEKAIHGATEEIQNELKEISQLQYDHFEAMIPKDLKPLWKEGLDSGDFYFKLCGAGGGGFMLVYLIDEEALLNINYPLSPLSES